jgi:HAD superfamily hydrolase (TIGR01509 family)
MAAAYIFDLDGTLIDAEILWVEATRRFLEASGCPISHDETVQMVYGRAWQDVYKDIVRRFPAIGMSRDVMNEAMKPYFVRLRNARDIRIPGSIALLQRLAARAPVCIVSGSGRREVAEGIALMGIEAHLSFYLGSEDYSPGKPDPACFLAAAERLGVPAAQCVVFEDSAAGVLAAKRAGMYCVALVRDGMPRQDVSPADRVLRDLAEFDPS